MFQAFVVISREACELLLVVLALVSAARRGHRPELARWILAGMVLGIAATLACIAALPHSGMNEWLGIALTFGFGLSLALVSSGTMASIAGVGTYATRVLDAWFAHRSAGAIVLAFVAFSALRESLESFLLIRFIAAQEPAADVAWGVALGLLACALLATAWRALESRRATRWAFRMSGVLLFVLGMQMMIEALAETLMRGIAGHGFAQLGFALMPYLENGQRYWMLSLALAVIPLVLWTRTWWRRAGV